MQLHMANTMRARRWRAATAIALLLLAAHSLKAQPAIVETGASHRTASEELLQLIDAITTLKGDSLNPTGADLPPTFGEVDKQAYQAHSILERIDGLDRTQLSVTERQTADVIRWDAWVATMAPRLFWYSSPLMPSLSPLRGVRERAQRLPLDDAEDGQAFLDVTQQASLALDYIDSVERGRLDRSIVLPKEQLDRVLPLLRGFALDAEQQPLWPRDQRLEQWRDHNAAEVTTFQEQLRNVLEREVAPRAAALAHFVDQTLRGQAPEAVGMGQYPGGKEAYALAVKINTTLDVTPEQVHQIGLAGVADLNRQMAELRDHLEWQGTKAQFHEHLREDERFYVEQPHEFGDRLLAFDARIRPLISQQVGKQPQAPYTVRRLDPALEATMTYGYYSIPTATDDTGYYNFNGSELDSRSLLAGAALTYHELVPGHHFQLAIQMENEDLPSFRRNGYYSGYGEGWGEYSSSVIARELGLYEDPYDLYGRLVFDMFFCVRLVVDTGMNYFGWSRQRAMDYMAEHTLESKVQIDSETIRYSMRWPGQALAYRMGLETWTALRQRAEQELGTAFDVRRFHDAALEIGAVPLTVLEQHVEDFLAAEKARRSP